MSRSGSIGIGATLSGVAVVCCVHDREKAVVTTERQVAELGLELGIVYDRKIHRLFSCSCCRNLFFDVSDEPRYCVVCRRGVLVHALGGPLPKPEGAL